MASQEVQDLLNRYKSRIESELGPSVKSDNKPITSADYESFRKIK